MGFWYTRKSRALSHTNMNQIDRNRIMYRIGMTALKAIVINTIAIKSLYRA